MPLAIGVAAWILRVAANVPVLSAGLEPTGQRESQFARHAGVPLDASLASVVCAQDARAPSGSSGPLAQRFRLVGAGASGDPGATGGLTWTVVLEERATRQQRMVRPGDWLLPDAEVLATGPTAVRVRTPEGEQSIGRSADEPDGTGAGTGGRSGRAIDPALAGQLGGSFGGRQIAPNRWEFGRPALMDYYRELANEPERLLAVFDSLQPLYGSENKIEGYRLQVVGEAAFFQVVGLADGDVVRSVNSVPMTNRRRAEHFIRRVVEAELDTIVLDVERNGANVQQIYRTVP